MGQPCSPHFYRCWVTCTLALSYLTPSLLVKRRCFVLLCSPTVAISLMMAGIASLSKTLRYQRMSQEGCDDEVDQGALPGLRPTVSRTLWRWIGLVLLALCAGAIGYIARGKTQGCLQAEGAFSDTIPRGRASEQLFIKYVGCLMRGYCSADSSVKTSVRFQQQLLPSTAARCRVRAHMGLPHT